MTKRILCIHQGAELYGSDRVFVQSVMALRRAYPDAVITVHLPQEGPIVRELRPYTRDIVFGGLWVLRRARFHPKYWRSLLRIPRIMANTWRMMRGHDMVYINTITLVGHVLCARFVGRPVIVHAHEFARGFTGFVMNVMLAFSDAHMVANSRATAAAFPMVRKKQVISNAVPDIGGRIVRDPFAPPLKLLLIGRINAWKGHHLVLDTLNILRSLGRNVKIRFVGSAFEGQEYYKDRLVARVERDKTEQYVDIWTFDPNPAFHYQWADVLLVPSTDPEPFGLVAIEGMSATLPVIAANHGGLSDIIVHDQTGFLFAPRDAHALADAIMRYDDAPDTRVTHGKNARQRFLDCYAEERYIDAFNAAIKAIAGF